MHQNLSKEVNIPLISGLQSTLLQRKSPLKRKQSGGMMLQIIHTWGSHWAAVEVLDTDIRLYDSAYASTGKDTMEVLAQH